MGEEVRIRAFRGTRRSSVYRECVVPERVFQRLLAVGERKGLPSLSSLAAEGPHTLDKNNARRLAREMTAVDAVLNEPQLPAIIEIALWCAHATATAWLTIAGPQAQA
jgi:hypothetical protein